ncbi:MAG: DUF4352 domain-containing protein, partial [Candidatus Woesearchaeota archaeon]|nr:DUF4352 domain-containing protein [Candidatus Woesearchaeota archaeon]
MGRVGKSVGALLLVLFVIFVGCKSIPEKPTKLQFQEPIIVDDVSITFDSVRFGDKVTIIYEGKTISVTADKGYKFVVIDITSRNVGSEEEYFPFYTFDMEIKVDKGYRYKHHFSSEPPSSMRPEDVETGYVVFEILEDTYPIELYIDDIFDDNKYTLSISSDNYLPSLRPGFKELPYEEKLRQLASESEYVNKMPLTPPQQYICNRNAYNCDDFSSRKEA